MARASTRTSNIKLVIGIVLTFIGIYGLDVALNGQLQGFGIRPRQTQSLPCILVSPFIHGSWMHLFNNIAGFIIFAGLALLKSRRFFIYSSVFIVVFGGLLVWLFARSASHIGASGWIFGLWALCIANAYFHRSLVNFCIAVFVILIYGGMAVGLLPTSAAISFEGHIFGAASGVIAARLFKNHNI